MYVCMWLCMYMYVGMQVCVILARVPGDAGKKTRESDISPRLAQVADRSSGEGSHSQGVIVCVSC